MIVRPFRSNAKKACINKSGQQRQTRDTKKFTADLDVSTTNVFLLLNRQFWRVLGFIIRFFLSVSSKNLFAFVANTEVADKKN